MKSAHPRTGRFSTDVLLTSMGMTGLVAPFLPFRHSTGLLFSGDDSPLSVIRDLIPSDPDSLWIYGCLAAPFFLSILVTGGALRLLVSGALTRVEQILCYVASTAMACLTVMFMAFVIFAGDQQYVIGHSLMVLPAAIVLLVGAGLVIRNRKLPARRSTNIMTALQTAYLANLTLCLVLFYSELGIGAYVAMFTAVVYIADIILSSSSLGGRGSHMSAVRAG
jgi:hypothetical protein